MKVSNGQSSFPNCKDSAKRYIEDVAYSLFDMEETLTVVLTPEMKANLEQITQTEGISPEKLVQEALEDYLFIRKFRALRSHLLEKAQSTYTDDEIFEQVS